MEFTTDGFTESIIADLGSAIVTANGKREKLYFGHQDVLCSLLSNLGLL